MALSDFSIEENGSGTWMSPPSASVQVDKGDLRDIGTSVHVALVEDVAGPGEAWDVRQSMSAPSPTQWRLMPDGHHRIRLLYTGETRRGLRVSSG